MSQPKNKRRSLHIRSRSSAPRFKEDLPETPKPRKNSGRTPFISRPSQPELTTEGHRSLETGWVNQDAEAHFGGLKKVVADRRKSKAATVRNSVMGGIVQQMIEEEEAGETSKVTPGEDEFPPIESVDIGDILGPMDLEFEEEKASIPDELNLLILTHAIRAVITPLAQERKVSENSLMAGISKKASVSSLHGMLVKGIAKLPQASKYAKILVKGTVAKLRGTYYTTSHQGQAASDADVESKPQAADDDESIDTTHLLNYLQRAFNVPTPFFRKLIAQELQWKDAYFQAEVKHKRVTLDSHKYYKPDQFETPEEYQAWKKHATKYLDQISKVHGSKQAAIVRSADFKGSLHVQVIDAQGLLGKDKSGKSDPYVKLKYEQTSKVKKRPKQKSKTRIIPQNLDPVWNEHHTFDVFEPTGTLTVQVWDKDAYGKDFLGQVIVPLQNAQILDPIDQRFTLDKRSKRSHVSGTLHLEIHFAPYDPPQTSQEAFPYHVWYRKLASSLYEFERSRETSFLSYSANLILKEFAAQHDLSSVFQCLTRLQVLVAHFDRRLVTLAEINRTLATLASLTDDPNLQPALLLREKEFFSQLAGELDKRITTILLKYRDSFPKNRPLGALRRAVVIYQQLAETPVFVEAHNDEQSLEGLFTNLIQSSIANNYEFLVKSVRKNGSIDAYIGLADSILDEVQEDALYFSKHIFPEGIDLVSISIKEYHSLLVLDLHNFLPSLKFPAETGGVDPTLFALYFRLRDMDSLFHEMLPTYQSLPILELFHRFIQQWITETADKLRGWTQNALAMDKFEPISAEKKHSSSVYDIFCSCYQYLDFFRKMEWPEVPGKPAKSNSTLAALLAQSIKMVLVEYTDHVQSTFFANLPKIRKKSVRKGSKEDKKPGFFKRVFRRKSVSIVDAVEYNIPVSQCVRLNDIYTCETQLEDFINAMKAAVTRPGSEAEPEKVAMCVDSFKVSFHDLHQALSNMLTGVLDSITPKIHQTVQSVIDSAAESPGDTVFAPFFEYVDTQLQIASDHMYYPVFRKVLMLVWNTATKHVVDVMVSQRKLSNPQLDIAVLLVMRMREFFYADGDGLPTRYLDIACEITSRTRELIHTSTPDLIRLAHEYDNLDDSQRKCFTSAHVVQILSERHNDKEAKNFCEQHSAAQHIQAAFRSRRARRLLSKQPKKSK